MFKRNQLDEMQEQKLLKIEHNGCWIAFWGLLAVQSVQLLLGAPEMAILPVWLLFMGLALYMAVACTRAGIWDRKLRMDWKTNLAVSAAAAVIFGAAMGLISYVRYHSAMGSLAAGLISGAIVLLCCFVALQLVARITKKRQAELEREPVD